MIIDIFQDNVCPWCRIGKANLFQALRKREGEPVEIRWRAFMLDPTVPEGGLPYLKTMKNKFGEQFSPEAIFGRVVEAGKASGVHFDFDKVGKMPNTRLSHRLIAIAPGDKKTELVEAVNKAYFEEGRDIGSREELLSIAMETGLDAAGLNDRLEQGEGENEVEEDFATAKRIGISAVPFFIIGRKYALSGAQPPEAFLKVMKRIEEEQAAAK